MSQPHFLFIYTKEKGIEEYDYKNQIFAQACQLINNRCGRVVRFSVAYESEPWGFEADEWFLNRVIVLETKLDPEHLLLELLEIERELGRVRHPEHSGYCSRMADLDILYYVHSHGSGNLHLSH